MAFFSNIDQRNLDCLWQAILIDCATGDVTINSDVDVNGVITADGFQSDTTAITSWSVGQLRWSDRAEGLVEDLDEEGISAPVIENTFKVKNTSGAAIYRGQVVYPSGASGDIPTVSLADASDFDKSRPVGIIRSESINDNGVGYVTTFGKIGQFDTSAFSLGLLYLHPTIPGALTNTRPSYPYYPVRVGALTRIHATEGFMIIDSDNEYDYNLLHLMAYSNGFDRANPLTMGADPTFDPVTRTMSHAVCPGEDEFFFLARGLKFTKTTTQTVVLPNVTGMYYVYYNTSGVLSAVIEGSVGPEMFFDYAPLALQYWNAEAQEALDVGDERHGIDMRGATHFADHMTERAKYSHGLEIEGLTAGGTTYTQTTSGCFFDEDIPHPVTALSVHPFLYRDGAIGGWRKTIADNKVGHIEAGDTYISYNEWTGAVWQLTENTAPNTYMIMFKVATPSLSGQRIADVIGHNIYSSKNDAREAIFAELQIMSLDGLPNAEIFWLYASIVDRTGAVVELSDGSLYLPLNVSIVAGGSGSSGTRYAEDIPTDTTNFDDALSSADANVQLALDTLNDSMLQENFALSAGRINNPLVHIPLNNTLDMLCGKGTVTFTRASTATYIDRYGVLKSAAVDEARFEKKGLLREGASTNTLLQSEDFGTTWTFVRASITTTTRMIALSRLR